MPNTSLLQRTTLFLQATKRLFLFLCSAHRLARGCVFTFNELLAGERPVMQQGKGSERREAGQMDLFCAEGRGI